LAKQFSKEPFISIGEGPNGFPIVLLKHDSGAEAMVHLHGGTISSWTDADNLEMLFVHPDNDFDPSAPIR
jgi:D-hexose-6-phosphate mutarotase